MRPPANPRHFDRFPQNRADPGGAANRTPKTNTRGIPKIACAEGDTTLAELGPLNQPRILLPGGSCGQQGKYVIIRTVLHLTSVVLN